MTDAFGDALYAGPPDAVDARFFDRFMFNGHPREGRGPSFVVGAGVYPARDVVDGFLVAVLPGEQRNARFSTALSAAEPSAVGPLRWSVLEPMHAWRVVLDDPAAGLRLDLTWRARAPAWSGTVSVANAGGEPTRFDHLFQSGLLTGELVVDGHGSSIDGWYSQRDRSRGVRTMAGGQGLHVWLQAQLPDRSIGFLLVESRDGARLQLEGAVMHVGGGVDPIVDVQHDLAFDERLDLRGGTVRVVPRDGAPLDLVVDASDRGGYLAGGGYGGHHGRAHGLDHREHDVYPLDGTVGPSTLDTPLTDRLARFECDGIAGSGIFEFAHSRSASYRYVPTAARSGA